MPSTMCPSSNALLYTLQPDKSTNILYSEQHVHSMHAHQVTNLHSGTHEPTSKPKTYDNHQRVKVIEDTESSISWWLPIVLLAEGSAAVLSCRGDVATPTGRQGPLQVKLSESPCMYFGMTSKISPLINAVSSY